ncbi:hypothetical protein G9P44_005182 [Scheffersomyces stipitis]|nr:hypothetical protein G9P44_005182 [Scheffersomyces stipitis]
MFCFFRSALRVSLGIVVLSILLKYLNVDFSGNSLNEHVSISWNHTPQQIADLTEELIETTKAFNDHIASLSSNLTVEGVLLPYIDFENESQLLINQLFFYQYVSSDKDIRDASTAAEELFSEKMIEQSLRTDVYEVFKKLQEKVDSGMLSIASKEHQLFLSKTMLGFRKNGLHLPEDQRQVVKSYLSKLKELCIHFSKNANEENGYILFSKEELEGVPKSTVDSFEQVDKDGVQLYKMTFKYPDIFPVSGFANNETTRKTVYLGNGDKCKANNVILEEIIALRYKLAKLLGFNSFSDYVLDETLAQNVTTAVSFLTDLRRKLTPLAQIELEKLSEFKGAEVFKWDFKYLENKMLSKQYQVNETEIAEYFPMESTIEKMLAIYEKLFDLEFQPVLTNTSVWHEDVRQYLVLIGEGSNKKFLGVIYFDLHPREGKYGHAANFGIAPGYAKRDGKSRAYPITALVCNFSKKTESKPSLLKHYEVKTFFHELGHGIHDLLGRTEVARFHGTNVPRDFVETPSQSFEFWTWEKSILKNLSSHYLTNEPLSDTLIDNLVSTKHVNGALHALRQLHFGLFDLAVHQLEDDESLELLNISRLWNNLSNEVSLISSGNYTVDSYGSFGHIAGGYESGYYSYFFSEVFGDDIYYTLFKDDPMSVENGRKYRDIVLSKGNSEDIMDNLKLLLGREPTSDAFLKEYGLDK